MSFDPNAFMSSSADPMPTQIASVREGEFPFILDSDPKMLVPKNVKGTSDKGPYDFWQLELVALCQSEEEKQRLGRNKLSVRLRVNIDIDQNTGKLEGGPTKNVALGRLREALGQNKPGWTPQALLGAGPFIGKVTHTTGKDGNVYADVSKVTKIS